MSKVMLRVRGNDVMRTMHSKSAAISKTGRAAELRGKLARKIAFFIGSEESKGTDVPGLTLSRFLSAK